MFNSGNIPSFLLGLTMYGSPKWDSQIPPTLLEMAIFQLFPEKQSHQVGHAFHHLLSSVQFSSVTQSCPTLCNLMARQASLSITNSWSLLKLMSIELVIPSKHLILCHPLLLHIQCFPASGSFPMSQFFASGGQSIAVSASALVLPMNIQDRFPLGLTALLSITS